MSWGRLACTTRPGLTARNTAISALLLARDHTVAPAFVRHVTVFSPTHVTVHFANPFTGGNPHEHRWMTYSFGRSSRADQWSYRRLYDDDLSVDIPFHLAAGRAIYLRVRAAEPRSGTLYLTAPAGP
jgi:hypothetical protein